MKANDGYGNLIVPIAVGIFAVAAGGAILYFLIKGRKKSVPITLQDPDVKVPLRLVDKESLTHDTMRFVFALPSKEHVLGLPTGQHVYVSARINGSLVVRPYTPVSRQNHKGYVELVVKIYRKNTHPRFPEGGKMSQYLENLEPGDFLDFRGPSGLLVYSGRGEFSIRAEKKAEPRIRFARELGLIAGGTGITPMYQLAQEVLSDPNDSTRISVLFANQSEDDILIRDLLEKLRDEHPDQFKIWYTVDRAGQDWPYSTGFVNAEMVRAHLPPPGKDTLILACGPPPMIQNAINPALDELGYSPEMRFNY